ncbi:MAG: glycosyltransferase [bacterium]|nr:glycosyltransferase [Candidatus Sumerlaeota bacterium]
MMLSIVIPNWNGAPFIARCIAATIQSAHASGLKWEIIVIDDASSDQSLDIIQKDFPSVKLLRNSANKGFGRSVNAGASSAEGGILVLLNNDLVPKEAMLGELTAPLLDDPGLFGVSAKTLNWTGQEPNHLNMAALWRNGQIELAFEDSSAPSPTMFLQGGSCAMRRAEFLKLGGFRKLFAPGYWEDYDLSYLAMKTGWRHLYNPRALAYHLGGGSMGRAYGTDYVEIIRKRNYFLFVWANLTDKPLLREHLNSLPRMAASGLLHDGERRLEVKGFARALKLAPDAAAERQRRMPFLRRSDREIFADFSQHGQSQPGETQNCPAK